MTAQLRADPIVAPVAPLVEQAELAFGRAASYLHRAAVELRMIRDAVVTITARLAQAPAAESPAVPPEPPPDAHPILPDPAAPPPAPRASQRRTPVAPPRRQPASAESDDTPLPHPTPVPTPERRTRLRPAPPSARPQRQPPVFRLISPRETPYRKQNNLRAGPRASSLALFVSNG